MNSRERVQRLLNHEPVDSIPNGLGGCETAGLHNLAYLKLKKMLGVQDPLNRVCTFMNNAIFEPSVIDAMNGDVILLGSPRMCPSRFWGPTALQEWKELDVWDTTIHVANDWSFKRDPDGTWWWGNLTASPSERTKCPPGALYFDEVPAPPEERQVFTDDPQMSPKDWNPPHDLPEKWLNKIAEDAKYLYDTTDYAIACGEAIQDLQMQFGGIMNWWMRLVQDQDSIHEFLDKAVDAALAQLKQLDQAVGQYCEFLAIANDIGDVNGVTIGPDLWREVYKPHYKRFFSEWHKITRMKVMLHCCGSVVDIFEDLVECGVDMFNPIQISARGMDPKVLKDNWGDRIVFYGGCYDAVKYPSDTPEDVVYEAVKSNIETFSRGGGYLFAGTHNLPGDIPEAHLKAMFQAWQDVRTRPDLTGRGQ